MLNVLPFFLRYLHVLSSIHNCHVHTDCVPWMNAAGVGASKESKANLWANVCPHVKSISTCIVLKADNCTNEALAPVIAYAMHAKNTCKELRDAEEKRTKEFFQQSHSVKQIAQTYADLQSQPFPHHNTFGNPLPESQLAELSKQLVLSQAKHDSPRVSSQSLFPSAPNMLPRGRAKGAAKVKANRKETKLPKVSLQNSFTSQGLLVPSKIAVGDQKARPSLYDMWPYGMGNGPAIFKPHKKESKLLKGSLPNRPIVNRVTSQGLLMPSINTGNENQKARPWSHMSAPHDHRNQGSRHSPPSLQGYRNKESYPNVFLPDKFVDLNQKRKSLGVHVPPASNVPHQNYAFFNPHDPQHLGLFSAVPHNAKPLFHHSQAFAGLDQMRKLNNAERPLAYYAPEENGKQTTSKNSMVDPSWNKDLIHFLDRGDAIRKLRRDPSRKRW